MTRRIFIALAIICTVGILSAVLLTGSPAGSASAQTNGQAPSGGITSSYDGSLMNNAREQIVQSSAGQHSLTSGMHADSSNIISPRTNSGLNDGLVFLLVSFAAILLTACVSIFTWGRARS